MFDTLFKTTERLGGEKQTSKLTQQIVTPKDTSYSVAPTEKSTPYTAELLKKSLTPEMQRLVASGKAVLHDTQATLPGTNHPANVQGMTTAEGVTHYVANKLNPTTIQNVALHEVGVHAGLKNMIGDKVWEDVKNQAMTNQGPEFDAARASIPKDTPAHLHAEEALAYLVENSPHLPFIRRLIAAVRNWARTTFGANIRLSQDDARHLATRALRKESKTAQTTARKEGTAFSFAGKKARTANKTSQEEAFRRTLFGHDPETVRKETGWHKGHDGKWRFEVSDKDAAFTKNAFKKSLFGKEKIKSTNKINKCRSSIGIGVRYQVFFLQKMLWCTVLKQKFCRFLIHFVMVGKNFL